MMQKARGGLAIQGPLRTGGRDGGAPNNLVFVSPFACAKSAGTWTPTVASNAWVHRRTAADAAFSIYIPAPMEAWRGLVSQGFKLTSLEILYVIGTAAMDAVAGGVYKDTLGADGVAHSAAALTTTYDTGHDTAAERIDVDEHRMTLTIDSAEVEYPADGNTSYHAELVCDAAATSVFDLKGAIWHFTRAL